MNTIIKTGIVLLITALTVIACSSTTRDPYNDPDSQRSRAGQSQGDLSRDTSK